MLCSFARTSRSFSRAVDSSGPLCLLSSYRCRFNSSSAPKAATHTLLSNEVEEDSLRYLERPLGVEERPTTASKTWKEKTEMLMNQDIRMDRRRHLIKESAKGYYSDFNALRRFGGKTWIGPPSLIRAEHALYFPDVAGISLSTKGNVHTTDICAGRISVVAMLTTKMSEEHVDSFVKPTNDTYTNNPQYRFVQVNLQENVMKAFLVSFHLSSLRKTVPPPLHPTYIFSTQNMEYLRAPLGMVNKHIGYVYLLDHDLKVRWAGGGLATQQESTSLHNCVKVLLYRTKGDELNRVIGNDLIN